MTCITFFHKKSKLLVLKSFKNGEKTKINKYSYEFLHNPGDFFIIP